MNDDSDSNSLSTLIPFKNTWALIGYYLSVFAIIPCIGLVLGFAALICGFMGLSAASHNPEAKGRVHAWIAIVLGTITFLGNLVVGVIFLVAIARGR